MLHISNSANWNASNGIPSLDGIPFLTTKLGVMMSDLKNKISNILAVIVAVGTVIATALESLPADSQWYVWVGAAVIAIFGYFMGKNGDLSKKSVPTKV